MLDGKRHQAVVVAGERVAGTELPELVPVGELAEDPAQRVEQVDEPRRAVDRDRHLAPAQRERLEHAGQPEVVVGVVVGQEDLAEVDQPERRAEHLALGALGAVEEQAFAPAPDEQRGRRTVGGRHRAGRAEEDEVEVHPAECRTAAVRADRARGLGQNEALARADERPGKVVPLLEAVDTLARVSRVVRDRDGPERVPAPDEVGLLVPAPSDRRAPQATASVRSATITTTRANMCSIIQRTHVRVKRVDEAAPPGAASPDR